MEHKGIKGRLEIKDADKGTVDAVFSTLGVKDSDWDVTNPGAFEDGANVVISAYGHKSWQGALPTGKGTIREVGNEAVMSGQFFMDTSHGLDTFNTVKSLADSGMGEWSYGYDPVEYAFGDHGGEQVRFLNKVKVHEVSPVLRGAGIDTRTTGTKSLNDEIAEAMDVVSAAIRGAERVDALRAEKGKSLSGINRQSLDGLVANLKRLNELLTAEDVSPDNHDAEREFLLLVSNTLELEF